MTTMNPLREAQQALPEMPEPLALVAQFCGEWREAVGPASEPIYTADQLRAYAREAVAPYRAALERIAALTPERISTKTRPVVRCRHCGDQWYADAPESHESHCAYVIARAILEAQR